MKVSNPNWKERLVAKMPDWLAREIDIFESEIMLRKTGKIDEKVFAETRLRRGAYGQRYDNGHRHDGIQTQILKYPAGELTKGPETAFDAPGMLRIKIPFGGMTAEQLEVMGELAEEYSDGIAHVTTRQDFQLHFIHIEDTPTIMRRLAAVHITTREACGNSVRNVTACPIAGVCHDEAFDVTPYAKALAYFLMGHPDTMDFGRKFKPAFSGCKQHACGLTNMHDWGVITRKRTVDGVEKRGFELYVGGGLGSVPHPAKLFDEFVSEEELFPITQAIARVFGRLGEKKNRARARIKFVVAKLGIEEFKRLVLEERKLLSPDPRWTDYLKRLNETDETPIKPPGKVASNGSQEFHVWQDTNVYPQRQEGYAMVTVKLPLGDITAGQLRKLADISRKYVGDAIRTTVEQNLVLRWVSLTDLPALYEELKATRLAQAGAGTIQDIVACPGTDTCKLGIAASRGLASELMRRLDTTIDPVVRSLRIKISGCFNSCGQHHVADIGFYGVSRNIGSYTVPHFQVVIGGQWHENGGVYGLAVGAIPSKRAPDFVNRITLRYKNERHADENFQAFIKRIGKVEIKAMLDELAKVPDFSINRDLYSDWGDPRVFTLGDMGTGECAGEVVSRTDFELTAAEREVFEAQVELDKGNNQKAGETAYVAMLHAAGAITRIKNPGLKNENETVVNEFRTRLVDPQIFHDKFAGSKFAQYLFIAHQNAGQPFSAERAHQIIEEAQLFVEASYTCYAKIQATPAGSIA